MERQPSLGDQPELLSEKNIKALSMLIGVDDIEQITHAVSSLKKEIGSLPSVGATLDIQKGSHRKEFVIPLFSEEQKEVLIDILNDLSIYPWEEDQLLIIENSKDLQKLYFGGLIDKADLPTAVFASEPYTELAQDDADAHEGSMRQEFRFPLKSDPRATIFPSKQQIEDAKSKAVQDTPVTLEASDEPQEIDKELQEIMADFDKGILDDSDTKFVRLMGDIPTLKLFPRKYIWENGVLKKARSGEEISKEELQMWEKDAQAGDEHRLEELIRVRVGYVLTRLALIKRKFPQVDSDDLFQEGLIGLAQSIKKHDLGQGSFLTYATYWIDQRMLRYAKDNRKMIRRPEYLSAVAGKYYEAEKKSKDAYNNTQAAALSENLNKEGIHGDYRSGHSIDKLQRKLLMYSTFDPLDESFGQDADASVVDMLGQDVVVDGTQESAAQSSQLRKLVSEMLLKFKPREERILRMRFGLNDVNGKTQFQSEDIGAYTLEEIGQQLGVSKDRIRQIEAKALRMLKHPINSKRLRPFLDA